MVVEATKWRHRGNFRSHSHRVCFAKRTSCLYINQVSGHCKWVFRLMSKFFFSLKNSNVCGCTFNGAFWDFIAVCARDDSACNERPCDPLETMELLCFVFTCPHE